MSILQGAEPYLLSGGTKGVLLVHGFTGSPAEMRPLADYLHGCGYTVLAPLLPGHGTSIEDLEQKHWLDWYLAVQDAYDELKRSCSKIYFVGISMGGLLCLKLAAQEHAQKLVVMSTPIALHDRRAPLVPFISMFKKYVRKGRRNYNINRAYNISYSKYPLKSLKSMLELLAQVKAVLPQITVPTLVVQSLVEKTVQPRSAEYIYDRIKSTDKEILWLKNSGHMVTLDEEREIVFQRIRDFFSGRL